MGAIFACNFPLMNVIQLQVRLHVYPYTHGHPKRTLPVLGGVEAGKLFGAVRLLAGNRREEKEARLFRIINEALTFPACSQDYFAEE